MYSKGIATDKTAWIINLSIYDVCGLHDMTIDHMSVIKDTTQNYNDNYIDVRQMKRLLWKLVGQKVSLLFVAKLFISNSVDGQVTAIL